MSSDTEVLPAPVGSSQPPVPELDIIEDLDSTLSNGAEDGDEVWMRYEMLENKQAYTLRVFDYLIRSSRDVDAERSIDLFFRIPLEERTSKQYFLVTQALLRMDHSSDILKRLVQEAVSQDHGIACWSYAFMSCVYSMRWNDMCDLWQLKPLDVPNADLHSFLQRPVELPDKVLALTDSMIAKEVELGEAAQISKYLLNCVFSSPQVMLHISISKTVNLTQNFYNLGLLEPEDYALAIATCATLDFPSNSDLSVAMYRNYCWRMTARPSRDMLYNLGCTITHSGSEPERVHFIVDEFRFFYGYAPPALYRFALSHVARAGDIAGVDRLFNLLVEDHGLPDDTRFYAPYLSVYARLGRVDETRARFDNLRHARIYQSLACKNVLLMAYANVGDFIGAFSLFKEMASKPKFNHYTVGILALMCAKRGDTDTISALIELAMADEKVTITTAIIEAAVGSCLTNNQPEEAEIIAESAADKDYRGSKTNMWNLIISHYALRYQLECAFRVNERLDHLKIPRNDGTYASLMLALAVVGRTDDALQIVRDGERKSLFHITQLHYSILLRGYVRERNRHMVQVISHEMRDRFKNPLLNSQVAILQTKIQRDLSRHDEQDGPRDDSKLKLIHAERFLENTTAQSHSDAPEDGKGDAWWSLKESSPGAFYEHMIWTYGTRGAFEQIDTLLDKYKTINTTGISPIRLLSTLMRVHVKREQYDQACECWEMAFSRATRLATRPDKISEDIPKLSKTSRSSNPVHRANKPSTRSKPTRKPALVSPAFRFSLSKCISLYIQALAFRGQGSKLLDVITDIETRGFSLSTQNWSMYVKMMASSSNPADQLRAFTLFENKFMPNFPGWADLRRGKGTRPSGAPSLDFLEQERRRRSRENRGPSNALFARRIWANIRPDFMQPTYITMVYLGAALLDFRERSVMDSGAELRSLYAAAPKTFAALIEMPHIREKLQGVLIRGYSLTRVEQPVFRFNDDFAFTGGVEGDGDPRLDTSPEAFEFEEMWNNARGEEDGGEYDPTENYGPSDTSSLGGGQGFTGKLDEFDDEFEEEIEEE
ncbi:hypothetical protein FQN54_004031 [Arachnomyces sp. PD_36]|nr:hypothetical protein FQN54_004031 [Arachnomyces sp. PD_36]